MKLTCPNNHAAVIRHDPESDGYRAMCDQCGWTANKVAVELDRAQKDEARRRQEANQARIGRGQDEEQEHRPARQR